MAKKKPSQQRRGVRITILVTEQEKQAIERASAVADQSVGDWIRKAAKAALLSGER